MAIMPDTPVGVNGRTPNRLPGRGTSGTPRSTVGRFLAYDYNAEWRHRTPGDLLRAAEAFWTLPPALQPGAYFRLAALACEVADRLLVLTIVDGAGGQEVA